MLNFIINYKFRLKIVLGLILVLLGFITNIYWFYIGFIPLIVGITKFCPACYFLNKCSLKKSK